MTTICNQSIDISSTQTSSQSQYDDDDARALTRDQVNKYFESFTNTSLPILGLSKISHSQYMNLLYEKGAKNDIVTLKSFTKCYPSKREFQYISAMLMMNIRMKNPSENFNCVYCSMVTFNETDDITKTELYFNIHLLHDVDKPLHNLLSNHENHQFYQLC
jgi:hypothetical protein